MNGVKLMTAALLTTVSLAVDAADLYWRGTSANPVWDTSTLNWATSASGAASTTFSNDSSTTARFDGNGAKDVMVDVGGIGKISALRIDGGAEYVLHGGKVTATYFQQYDNAMLTILNTIEGWATMNGSGTIAVGDGGLFRATYFPTISSESGLDSRLLVLTGGVLRVNIDSSRVSSHYSTIYFDGGTLIHPASEDRQFVNSRILLGPGGMRVREDTAGQYSYIPGPIGTDVENDDGIWIEDHTGYMLLPNYTSTYRGGLHILGSGGHVAVRDDSHLGATPNTPTNNIFFANNSSGYSSLLVSHGNVTLNPNRDILISDGVRARIGARNSSNSWTIRGAISCDPAGVGKLQLTALSDGAAAKPVAIETANGRTNHIGALIVNAPAIIGDGTTLLEGSTYTGTGDNAIMNISADGRLMVTGGVLRTVNGKYVCNSGQFTVSGGIADFTSSAEFLSGNSSSAAATTTVSRAGRLVVNSLRVGDESRVSPSNAVVRLVDGGVLRVNNYLWVGVAGRKGMLDFDGGVLEWASSRNTFKNYAYAAVGAQYEGTREGLSIIVREGGMVITNDNPLYVDQSIQSGAAHDGGITKWGTAELALQNGTNTFNGPIRIMQGSFAVTTGLRNAIDTNVTVCINSGARFRMNGAYHVFDRIEGGGEYAGMVDHNLTVKKTIAPGMGADSLGTLTISGGACNIEDGVALEIDVDRTGNSDCFSYPAQLDLSKMELRINDTTKLNRTKKYLIATLNSGVATENGMAKMFKFTNLPGDWKVRYSAGTHELKLIPVKGTVFCVR